MKRGTVYLEDHCTEWETAALHTIDTIKNVPGLTAADVCHVGSTSIKSIPAKPIIDIAVGVFDLNAVLLKKDALADKNIIFRFEENPDKLLFVMGDFENDTRTHHIHVVKYGSEEWENYLNFRDYLRNCSSITFNFCLSDLPCTALNFLEIRQYSCENLPRAEQIILSINLKVISSQFLNANATAAERYASLKRSLAEKYPDDRIAYTQGKSKLSDILLDEARIWRNTK